MRAFFVRLACSLFVSFVLVAPTLAADSTYTIVRGDTLTAIAAREHVSVSEIVRLNHLRDADYLREGEVLRLAAAPVIPKRPRSLRASRSVSGLTAKHGHGRRVAIRSAHHDGPAQIAESRALWVATHSGSSVAELFASGSFAAAQRAFALEVHLTRTAMRYLGVPYVWGGESFSGVDCSGFVQAVFRRNGVELPRTADAQFAVGRRIPASGLQPGDLVFFETYALGASHVGIYLGDGNFVHASASHGVRVDSLSDGYYSNRYLGARRLVI